VLILRNHLFVHICSVWVLSYPLKISIFAFPRFMKILKFTIAFLVIAAALFAVIIGVNLTAFKAVFSDRTSFAEGSEWIERTYSLAGLVEFMEANPQHVSIVTVNIHDPEDAILYNETEMRPLGALYSLFLVIEYAKQVESGGLNPETRIPLDEINRFIVPGWYESANRNAIRNLRSSDNMISLDEVVTLVTRHYSQAASDWLFFQLGAENVNQLTDSLGLGYIERYAPAAGIQSAIILRDAEMSKDEAVQFYLDLEAKERSGIFQSYAQKFIQDDDFRSRVKKSAPRIRDRKLADERRVHRLFSRAQPIVFTEVAGSIFRRDFISEELSNKILSRFLWAGEDPVVRQHTTIYGALFESRLSYLSAFDFGTSVYTERSYVQTVFFSDLPIAFWLHMSSNFMNHEYQRRLIYDPEMRRITALAAEGRLTEPEPEQIP